MLKKILKFLQGPPVKDLRTNNPCEMARRGMSCPFVNCYIKCVDCEYYSTKDQDNG